MHGVGKDVLLAAFARAGFPEPVLVAEQAEPGPGLPDRRLPQPGGARRDGPRLREGPRDGPRPGHRQRPGRRPLRRRGPRTAPTGACCAATRSARCSPPTWSRAGARGTFAESIVSSSLLGRIAEKAGLPYEETLTGFKWIARVEGLRYGYEEALGYCVDPEGVRDKDGITAALLITELASELKEQGRTLPDLLDDIAVRARPARHRPALGPRRGPVGHRRRHAAAARAAADRPRGPAPSPRPRT